MAGPVRTGLRARFGAALAAVLCVILAACASLPQDVVRTPSSAESGAGTALANIVAKTLPQDAKLGVSGFHLLPTGAYALDARIALASTAERTLDLQYYLLDQDGTGKQLLAAVVDAARRGVRIRLLLDDLYTAGEDDFLVNMTCLPNTQVRIFNPFPGARGSTTTRVLASLDQLSRVNRRMHNKVFIADNVMTISGGRNIADAYFTRAGTDSFVDLDVLSAGAIVAEQSAEFDQYWNSQVVYPIQSLDAPPADCHKAQGQIDQFLADRADAPVLAPTDPLGHHPIGIDLTSGDMEFQEALGHVIYDSPEKALGLNQTSIRGTVTFKIDEELAHARSDILIVSPYLIPGRIAMRDLEAAIARGVHVTIVTNSLAGTDVPLVYAGYAKTRATLLKLGVDLYELNPEIGEVRVKLGSFRSELGHLHAKAVVIDGQRVFIGSMNMDGRSGHLNTETGIILESQTIGSEVHFLINRDIKSNSYQVRLKGDHLEWVSNVEGHEIVATEEPGVSVWEKLELAVLSPFAPEELF